MLGLGLKGKTFSSGALSSDGVAGSFCNLLDAVEGCRLTSSVSRAGPHDYGIRLSLNNKVSPVTSVTEPLGCQASLVTSCWDSQQLAESDRLNRTPTNWPGSSSPIQHPGLSNAAAARSGTRDRIGPRSRPPGRSGTRDLPSNRRKALRPNPGSPPERRSLGPACPSQFSGSRESDRRATVKFPLLSNLGQVIKFRSAAWAKLHRPDSWQRDR
eukprot:766765-Hanusia_phi.AAC.3